MEEDQFSHEDKEDKKPKESHLTEIPDAQTPTTSSAGEGTGRNWWMTDVLMDSGHRSDHSPSSSSSRWDFRAIIFPDLGSSKHHPSCLSSPDPSLLPGALAVGMCDVAPWRRRINLRKVKMSSKERRREKDKHRRRRGVNKDKKVCRI